MAGETFARSQLEGGLTVLTEELPGIRSVALGVWARVGAVHEKPEEMGVSHLLEHMVFKGTGRRSALDIALSLERLGGSLDAYTTREHTSYQARVMDEHSDTALDVLADLVLNPKLKESDLQLERDVVLEEIATVDDTPDDLVFELHGEAMWGDHPFGYRILGTPDTIAGIDVDTLRRTHSRGYGKPSLIVAAAGSVQHEKFVEDVERHFRTAGSHREPYPIPEPRMLAPRHEHHEMDTAQTHIVFGTQTFGHNDDRRVAAVLLSNAFGGGMSSRLFQRVREELGLAYTVYAFQSFYQEAGINGVYVGTRHDRAGQATEVIREEMRRLEAEGLTPQELDDAKGQVKGQMVLALESTSAHLHRLAGYELYDEPFLTVEALMARVEAVTRDDVAAIAADIFDPDRQIVLRLGPAS